MTKSASQNIEQIQAELEDARWQLRIEAALDRLRTAVSKMTLSSELLDIVTIMSKEFSGLGFETVQISNCRLMPGGYTVSATKVGGDRTQFEYTWPFDGNPIEKGIRAWLTSDDPIVVFEYTPELATEHMEFIKTRTDYFELDPDAQGETKSRVETDGCFMIFARTASGAITNITWHAPGQKSLDVLVKFAGAFDLAYARFDDLKKAEAQTREAQIETALERVRGQAMAMRETDELRGIVASVFSELNSLEFNVARCLLWVFDKKTLDVNIWISDTLEKALPRQYHVPYHDDVPFMNILDAWHAREEDWVFELAGETKKEWDTFFFSESDLANLPQDVIEHMKAPDRIVLSATFTEFGALQTAGLEPLKAEKREILKRFGKVLDLTYSRFDDLMQAEAQAREAQIEAALERVRSRTMAMQRSDELADIVGKIFEELTRLNFVLIRCIIWIFDKENNVTWWMANPEADSGAESYDLGYNEYPMFKTHLSAWQEQRPFLLYTLSGDAKAEFDEYLLAHTGLSKLPKAARDGMRKSDSTNTCSVIEEFGLLMVASPEPLADQNLEIVKRFGHVFQQSYTRFTDVQLAEAQAREARIDTALERIRTRTMAMHESRELADILGNIFKELISLDVALERCIFWVFNDEKQCVTWWLANPEAARGAVGYDMDYNDHPVFLSYLERWRQRTSIWCYTLSGETKISWEDHIFNHTGLSALPTIAQEGMRAPESVFLANTFRDFGLLMAASLKPFSEDNLSIIQRFSQVFQQSYTRFTDVQRAEAQAREAQIEAALERVRAQAMGMQSSEDIGASILRLFEEIPVLCPEVMRLGLAVIDNSSEMDLWLAGKDDEGKNTMIDGNIISRDARPEVSAMMTAWEQGVSYSFRESEDFLLWARKAVFNDPNLTVIPIDVKIEQHLSSFYHQRGVLFAIAGEPLTPEEGAGKVIQRFTGVFELAYQRFHDLKQAEQDYAALLEEKARTENVLSDLQATQKQLIEQEKLASLGALTAGIAHEIKNPLNFVNNFAEVSAEMSQEIIDALADGDLDEARGIAGELATNSEQIAKHGKRADSIVKSMMQHARGGASDMETVELNTYLEEYINLAWHGMRARDDGFSVEVKRDFDAGVITIQAMPQELGRVILNLLNNAFDAVRDTANASVTVSTRALDNDHVEITVSDNGPGIPLEIREKIFEPFFTTKATGEGTGLGLSLSHDIITKGHGGTLSIGEAEGGGAIFTIDLPTTSIQK